MFVCLFSVSTYYDYCLKCVISTHGIWLQSVSYHHVLLPLLITFVVLTDPSHQRAGGNLRYFEQLLMKQLREMNQDYQPPSEEPIQLGTYSRPKDHLPERESYEALCRGEGIQMASHPADSILSRYFVKPNPKLNIYVFSLIFMDIHC